MSKNYWFLVGFILTLNNCSWSKGTFTNSDIDVIGRITKYLNPECVVVVKNDEDISLLKSMKNISGSDMYFSVVNSTVLEGILEKNLSQLKFLQRRTLIVSKEELNLTSLLNQVASPHYLTWLIFGDHKIHQKLYIPISSQVIFIGFTSGEVSATQVYHLKRGEYETVQKLDITGSPERLNFVLNIREMNFQKVYMKMLVLTPKEACLKMHLETFLKKIECTHQHFLELMGERLNYSINVVECQEKEYPFTFPNGSDSELFLRLKNREVDFSAISHVIRTRSKRNYMEFVWPTFVLKAMMYLKQGRLAGRWSSYLRPLENSVWWGILIWILTSGILVQVFEKLLSHQLKFNLSFALDLISSTLNTLQVFCNQALEDLPKSYSIRIIHLLKLLVVLVFFQAYSGYLISSLTIVLPHFPFQDMRGFSENTQYQIMTLKRGFHQFYFRKVVGEGQRENFMLPQDDLPNTIQQAVDKLCTQNYLAFTEFREDLLNFDKLSCKISELPSPIVRMFVGIAMPKKTPLKEYLRRELLYLKSTGIVKRLASRLSSRTDFRNEKSPDEFIIVSMTQIFSIFILLGMGVALSLIVFMIELIVDRTKTGGNFRFKKIR